MVSSSRSVSSGAGPAAAVAAGPPGWAVLDLLAAALARRCAARPPASRSATRLASALYCGSRSFRSASTGVAMQIDE